jgi:hypothetical protein
MKGLNFPRQNFPHFLGVVWENSSEAQKWGIWLHTAIIGKRF